MENIVEQFADQEGLDPNVVRDRWEGNPRQIAEDIFRIQDLDTGEYRDLSLFDPIQTKALDAYFYSDAKTISAYKGRRIGYSFIFCLAFLIDGMIHPNSVYPVVAVKQDGAQSRIRDIRNLIEHAKVDIPLAKNATQNEIILWNGSKFKAYSGAPDSSRGDDSARAVLLDEMAFYEDQEAVSRAFRAFIILGKNRKMVQVSTPYLSNDLFMRTFRSGTADGSNGTLSLKQPTFYNAEEIDPEVSLHEQTVYPVRPDLDVQTVEEERAKDPEGFAQEYLCKPISDSYAFFCEDSIIRAQGRASAPIPKSGMRVMGVDIGISRDDTVISVFQHGPQSRHMVHFEVVTDRLLAEYIDHPSPDRGNANHVAERLTQLVDELGVDRVYMDRTGPGETFDRIITERIGGKLFGFNFSDAKGVQNMMGDLNNALRNDRVSLFEDERILTELSSIIKIKKKETSRPEFTGKDTSETGKDDVAWSIALGAFPPGTAVRWSDRPAQRHPETESEPGVGERPRASTAAVAQKPPVSYGSTTSTRRNGGRKSYRRRYSR